jgi:hypothetical protein
MVSPSCPRLPPGKYQWYNRVIQILKFLNNFRWKQQNAEHCAETCSITNRGIEYVQCFTRRRFQNSNFETATKVYIMQRLRCKYGWLALSLLWFCGGIQAQEGREARVYFAEGGGFLLASGGQRAVHQAESLEAGGFSLRSGDVLRTDPGTFVEIQLIPQGTVIKAAGNTSLVFNFEETGVILGLAYGRILLLGGDADATESLSVRPGTAELVFRGGDIGVDYVVQAAGEPSPREPQIRVYAFAGSADLIPREGTAVQALGRGGAVFPVHAGEMVSLETAGAFSYVERKPLDPELTRYWTRHLPEGRLSLAGETTEASPPDPAPAGGEAAARGGRVLFIPPDYQPFFRTNTLKNGFVAAGITFSLIGAGMQGLAWYMQFDNGRTNDILRDTGYGFIGLGVLSLGAALFINPQAPEADGAK